MNKMFVIFCLMSAFLTISISAQADMNERLQAEVQQRIQLKNAAITNEFSLDNKQTIAERNGILTAAFNKATAELAKSLNTSVSVQNSGEIEKNGSATNAYMLFKSLNDMICEMSWFPGGNRGPGFVSCITGDGIMLKTEFDANGSLSGALKAIAP